MAQQMSLKGRAFMAGAAAPRVSTRSVAVRAANKEQQVPFVQRLAPSMLAGLVALSTGLSTFDAVYAPAARADEDENMSPYEKRQAELERRRELLREAREKAAARAAAPIAAPEIAAPAPAPAPAAPSAPSLSSNSLQSYQAATQNRPTVPTPPPEPEAPSVPKWGGFNFSKPAAEEPPAAPTPAPTPAPRVKEPEASSSSMFSSDMWNTPIKPKAAEPAPAPVAPPAPVTPAPSLFKAPEPAKPTAPEPVKKVEAKKVEAKKAEKPGKRRGPLPLWFAEILMLGAYAGFFLAVTKYSQQSGDVLKAVWTKVLEAYKALDKLINKPKTA